MANRQNSKRQPFYYSAQQRYPFRVDIPVPAYGFGQLINELHDWITNNGGEAHGHVETADGKRHEVLRAYFHDKPTSKRYQQRYGGVLSEK